MTALLDPKIESVLQSVILVDLGKGRKDFDRPHTEAVVYFIKQLLPGVQLPPATHKVMITAAYAHDWGYIGLFDGLDSSDITVIHRMKPLHMERGAVMIRQLLESRLAEYFSALEIAQVASLVGVHDKIEELTSEEEILLMEADTLGMLDVDRVKPTFSPTDNAVFIERELYGRRLPRFRHVEAKRLVKHLAEKRKAFYAKHT